MPVEPEKVFPKPLREYLRDGLEQLAPTLFPKVASELLQREPYCQFPKEVQDKISSQIRELVHPIVVNLFIDEVGPYLDNLQESLERIQKLGLAATTMRSDTSEDALRASVVLLHASLEDFLRTLATELLPTASEDALNEIPLVGVKGRPKNFGLGKLVRHRGKTVDDVLRDSVCEYLERSNYNSTQEIASLLELLGLTAAEQNTFFPLLEQMIKRRHEIVHRADKIKAPGSVTYVLQPIESADVQRWTIAVTSFIVMVLPSLALKMITPEKALDAAKRYSAERPSRKD
jgi:HEPN superfamily RiboL-PSP-like protein